MKKILSVLVCVAFLLTAFVQIAFAAGTGGESGDIEWQFETETGILTVMGQGNAKVPDFDSTQIEDSFATTAPWNEYRSSIKHVEIYGVGKVGDYAFAYMPALESVYFEEGVTYVGFFCFAGCSALKELYCPGSLAKLEDFSFNGCKSLETVYFAAETVWLGDYCFAECESLTEIDTAKVAHAEQNTFAYCKSLRSVTVTCQKALDSGIYAECRSLEEVTIMPGVTEIPMGAFERCTSLEYIVLPEGLERIESLSFLDCKSLRWIYIPASVTEIERVAFNEKALTDVYFGGTEEEWAALNISEKNNRPLYNATVHFGPEDPLKECDALGHEFSEEYTFEVQPAEGVVGIMSRQCVRCNETADAFEVEYLPGDVNGDGIVSALDQRAIKLALVGVLEENQYAFNNADINKDEHLTAKDLAQLKKLMVR